MPPRRSEQGAGGALGHQGRFQFHDELAGLQERQARRLAGGMCGLGRQAIFVVLKQDPPGPRILADDIEKRFPFVAREVVRSVAHMRNCVPRLEFTR